MKGLLVFICGTALLASPGQEPYKHVQDYDWRIAQRLDSGRVVIMLTDQEAKMTDAEGAALAPLMPKPASDFLAKFVSGARPISVDAGRRWTNTTIGPGDKWMIDGGRFGWFESSIDEFVLTDEGCSEIAAATARVSSNALPAFAKVRAKYFPARAVSGWAPPTKTTSVGTSDYIVTPNDRENIERALQQAFDKESPAVLEKMRGRKDAGVPEMRELYRRISAGSGRIRFDVQAFRVTPDGLPRLFVRAGWTLDGKTVFLMSAWLRTAPIMQIEGADVHSAEDQFWEDFNFDGPMDPSTPVEILNVVDVDRDGLAEIVMLYQFYEGISIEVSKYPPARPGSGQVIAKYGGGC